MSPVSNAPLNSWSATAPTPLFSVVLLVAANLCGSPAAHAQQSGSPDGQSPAEAQAKDSGESWRPVPTDDSKQWEVCNFGGEGDVRFGERGVIMRAGDPLTGVRCLADLPREDFEIAVECRRLSNFDFFCGLTFPVGEGNCSLIVGGWAGAIVGLSSIDGADASENQTKRFMTFENERWYRIRARVDQQRVRCWIDDKMVVDQPRGDHEFEIRVEMDLCRPVGIAAFMCDAEFRNFRWRKLGEHAPSTAAPNSEK